MKILITGARGGIGYATALELLHRDHFVYITVHTEEQLKELEQKEELKGLNVKCLKLDITSKQDRDIIKNLDIDVLINNAAIGNGGSLIANDVERIRENYEVNVFATLELTKIALDNMIKKDSGKILMVSSVLAEMPFAWLGFYSSTKAAIKNLSIALQKELKAIKSKVKVSIIIPGAYHTGFNQVMLENKYDEMDMNTRLKKLESDIRIKENIKFGLLESKDLQSIVDKIVTAVEAEKPKSLYKAPLVQSIAEKTYMITKK